MKATTSVLQATVLTTRATTFSLRSSPHAPFRTIRTRPELRHCYYPTYTSTSIRGLGNIGVSRSQKKGQVNPPFYSQNQRIHIRGNTYGGSPTAATTMSATSEAVSQSGPVKGPVKKREVVSSFILKTPEPGEVDGKPLIALFKRSDKVSTYRNRLGAISGTIDPTDPTPEAAALRELSEETTLTLTSLTLLRKGKPYVFVDEKLNREWTIHPFLFQLKHSGTHDNGNDDGITIDWEHTGYEWVDPMTVPEEDEGIVPKIHESLRRVWVERDLGPTAGLVLVKGLEELRDDHVNGARVLAGNALETLVQVVWKMGSIGHLEGVEGGGVDEYTVMGPNEWSWWYNVRMAAWHLWRNGRPAMDAAIRAVVVEALHIIETTLRNLGHFEFANSSRSLPIATTDQILGVLKQYRDSRTEAADNIANAFTSYLEEVRAWKQKAGQGGRVAILTLSSSSTVNKAISEATERGILLDIRVLESRPLMEGVAAAAKFAGMPGTRVSVYPDAGVAQAAVGADMVVLGADRISEVGGVSNKLGSLPAVLAARHVSKGRIKGGDGEGVAVVVLGEREKVSRGEGMEEENPGCEVVGAWMGATRADVRQALSVLGGVSGKKEEAVTWAGIKVRNLYFEWVYPDEDDLEWVYICETGRWGRDDIAKRMSEGEELTEKLLKDL